jgi:hypothetical protein
LVRHSSRGFALLDETWLSGACTPGLRMELVVEDVTPALALPEPGQGSPRASPESAALPAIGDPPRLLHFSLLPSAVLKLVVAGAPPKKKNTKKPAAATAAAGVPKPAPAPAAAAAAKEPQKVS